MEPRDPAARQDNETDGLFDWVTDFDNPVVARAVARRAPRPSRVPLPTLVGGGSFLIVGATIVAALMRPFEAESGLPTAEIAAPVAPATPSGSPTAPAAFLTCDELYGVDMLETLAAEGMELNGTWTGVRELPAGTSDPQLLGILAGQVSCDCFWLDAAGGAQSGVLTTVMPVDTDRTTRVAARLAELGFAQQQVHGGTRYFVEHQANGETAGESHFLRDGLWFATNWYGFGPWGYTAHMAENVFS